MRFAWLAAGAALFGASEGSSAVIVQNIASGYTAGGTLVDQYGGPGRLDSVTIDVDFYGFVEEQFDADNGPANITITGYADYNADFINPSQYVVIFGAVSAVDNYDCHIDGPTICSLGAYGHYNATLTGAELQKFIGGEQLYYLGTSFGGGSYTTLSGEPRDLGASSHQASYGSSGTLTYTVSLAPEPSTWASMLAGFGAVGATMRRRGPRPMDKGCTAR